MRFNTVGQVSCKQNQDKAQRESEVSVCNAPRAFLINLLSGVLTSGSVGAGGGAVNMMSWEGLRIIDCIQEVDVVGLSGLRQEVR